ncbi:MAG: dihydrolipoamide succinyltransferase, partial [Proteobacteria bacterium]|nr:dihydrolipoamide succinyltransferase [Pseudomonadota bacterium]
MTIEIKSPTFPESVADGTVANWLKKEGDPVSQDEIIAEIETDKVVLEVVAPTNGVITKIIKVEGDVVNSAEIIGEFNEVNDIQSEDKTIEEQKEDTPQPDKDKQSISKTTKSKSGPAAKKIIAENNLDASLIKASGKD